VLVVERTSLPASLPVGAKVVLPTGSLLLLGRDASALQPDPGGPAMGALCFLPLKHRNASREHGLLFRDEGAQGEGRWYALDLRSHNGLFLGGSRLRGERRAALHPQALLEVADVVAFRVHLACPPNCYCHCNTGQGRVLDVALPPMPSPTIDRAAQASLSPSTHPPTPTRYAKAQADAFLLQLEELEPEPEPEPEPDPRLVEDHRPRVLPSQRARHLARAARPPHVPRNQHHQHQPIATASGGRELDESNKGNRMLRSMGWTPGTSLGASSTTGITEPIRPRAQVSRKGLGLPRAPT
jgi:hypothetical protein